MPSPKFFEWLPNFFTPVSRDYVLHTGHPLVSLTDTVFQHDPTDERDMNTFEFEARCAMVFYAVVLPVPDQCPAAAAHQGWRTCYNAWMKKYVDVGAPYSPGSQDVPFEDLSDAKRNTYQKMVNTVNLLTRTTPTTFNAWPSKPRYDEVVYSGRTLKDIVMALTQSGPHNTVGHLVFDLMCGAVMGMAEAIEAKQDVAQAAFAGEVTAHRWWYETKPWEDATSGRLLSVLPIAPPPERMGMTHECYTNLAAAFAKL